MGYNNGAKGTGFGRILANGSIHFRVSHDSDGAGIGNSIDCNECPSASIGRAKQNNQFTRKLNDWGEVNGIVCFALFFFFFIRIVDSNLY
jgi:hypothetical protein